MYGHVNIGRESKNVNICGRSVAFQITSLLRPNLQMFFLRFISESGFFFIQKSQSRESGLGNI